MDGYPGAARRSAWSKGKENKKLAEQKFHELAALQARIPEAPSARVADVIEAFLAWAKLHRSEETLRNYLWYGEEVLRAFGVICGFVDSEADSRHPLDGHARLGANDRTQCPSVGLPCFLLGQGRGHYCPANPLNGMKCPKARTRERIMTRHEYAILMKNGRQCSFGNGCFLPFATPAAGPRRPVCSSGTKFKEDRGY